jgi:lysophospholipase L1-like esterase
MICFSGFVYRGMLLLASLTISRGMLGQHGTWIATWTASPETASPDPSEPLLNLEDQTLRERVRITAGGGQIRLRLSNECGTSPLAIGRVSVAITQDTAGVVAGSIREVRFGSQSSIVIPPGAPALSDPVSLPVRNGAEITVSIYLPNRVMSVTLHGLALRQSIVSGRGDHTQDVSIRAGKNSDSSAFLTGVLVPSAPKRLVIVAFGDSTVDGDGSTPEQDRAWPSVLFRRLDNSDRARQYAVVNAGLAGNRLLADGPIPDFGISGLARFERDALSVPGVTDIVVLEGTNDIGFPGAKVGGLTLAAAEDAPTTEDIIGAYRQLIARAHARGIRVIGATIMPSEGVPIPGYHSVGKEKMRQEVNDWIRGSREFDDVFDFDSIVRDPDHPSQLLARFASKDHLHPNDDGYKAMGDGIALSSLKGS